MLKSCDNLHFAGGRRRILVVCDDPSDRAMLGSILENDYELVFAADQEEWLKLLRDNDCALSAVLIALPEPADIGSGLFTDFARGDGYRGIPIVAISDGRGAEADLIAAGAADFIPKPYPEASVIKARVSRAIELAESRQTIERTERDPLTGLYNREYFYRYAEQFDILHKGTPMDAIVLDIKHFRTINERFGNAYGDEVLRRFGGRLSEILSGSGAIICRSEGNTFLIYCPHGLDYRELIDSASLGLAEDRNADDRICLRMGVYEKVEKSIDLRERFKRARIAFNSVRDSFTKNIGVYDYALHEQELYAEQLIGDFRRAVEEQEFKVFYQPIFDIRPERPVLAGVEALVRWQHPELGLIGPSIFMPLFEKNGLLRRLDTYVWKTAAAQIRDWKRRLGFTVPVSVKVSRIDMEDPCLIDDLVSIRGGNSLKPDELILEVDESGYTKDPEKMTEFMNRLHSMGFEVELDGFGSGYSSLHMINKLPMDSLKLDLKFVRGVFNHENNILLLKVIFEVARLLGIPVVAGGVETASQLDVLKTMGCDMAQGYYFSRPVSPEECEQFIIECRDQSFNEPLSHVEKKEKSALAAKKDEGGIPDILSHGFKTIYYVSPYTGSYVVFEANVELDNFQILKNGDDFFGAVGSRVFGAVCEEDRDRVLISLEEDALITQLADGEVFSLTYRVMKGAEPVFHNLKAFRTESSSGSQLVIGIKEIEVSPEVALPV